MARRKADEKREQLSVGVEEELKKATGGSGKNVRALIERRSFVSLASLVPAGAGGGVNGDGVRGLRAILKALLRRHGFRCIDCREAAR